MNHPLKDALGFLYRPTHEDHKAMGPNYTPPEQFEHGIDALVMSMPKKWPDGDGYAVEVYECRCPAVFFKIVVKPTANSVGRVRPGLELNTGSGGEELRRWVVQTAAMFTEGALGGAHE